VKPVRIAVIGVLLVACCLAAAGPATAGASTSAEKRMVKKVNSVRAGHGLRPLRGSRRLGGSAARYARRMLRADYFGHQPRIRASSRYSRLGENLAWHTGLRPRVRYTVRAWLNSPPHRALLLSGGFRWLGAGLARGRLHGRAGTTWVLHFGR
jgi:uncharacterized protein YkwD